MHGGDILTDLYYFHSGSGCRAYQLLGQHKINSNRVFRVWAPNASEVRLVGSFDGWNCGYGMERISDKGVWEVFLPADEIPCGTLYKYRIKNAKSGNEYFKADPYGYGMEQPPATASVVVDIDGFKWQDAGWLNRRRRLMSDYYAQPINIYEMHAGSWKHREDGSTYSWKELADELAPYVKQMGYTHVELMPVMEHPYGGSWGYQICGYYAPTSRYGSPYDFMAFVDIMHNAGIGVILDWVPAHFPKDAHGLYEFDGQPLYEYQGADRQENRGWGTRCFDLGREEVQSFLISNAVFWAEKYHADGLRVDAVASMLYLDYDKKPGEWIPNKFGGNGNLEAVEFLKKFNGTMKREFPDVLTIAEESTSWKNITSFEDGGLGFSLKWNMGWMHDTLDYAETDPLYRCYNHNKLNFPLAYAFNEKYVLPISHDEVVHGKKSLLDKMSGDYWQKFAGARAFACWMMTSPGKKLNFMGNEIGQFREWDYEGAIEWFLLDYESHARIQLFYAELNNFYLSHKMLWERDGSWDGFKWIDADDAKRSIISFRRIGKNGKELIVIINFTPATYEGFELAVPNPGQYTEVFNSDNVKYGGSGIVNPEPLSAGRKTGSLKMKVPSLGCVILEKNVIKKEKT